MLSNDYLQPSTAPDFRNRGREKISIGEGENAAALSGQERDVLAQEHSLKAMSAGAQVSTTYHYTVGSDGRRYITSAEVTVRGDERTVDRVTGGVKHPAPAPDKTNEKQSAENSEDSVVRELEETEREVIAHEAAHQAAAGRFAGGVSYTYTQGPDGRAYITGGEVPIRVPASANPEETLRNMEQVQRAALAPHSPSGQDLAVAASAAAAAAQARQKLASSGASPLKTEVASIKAGLLFDRIWAKEEDRGERAFSAEKDRRELDGVKVA
jgi:hypothetical protein